MAVIGPKMGTWPNVAMNKEVIPGVADSQLKVTKEEIW